MRTKEASSYLAEEHGVRLSEQTLNKLRCTGGGPRFRVDGRFPVYDQEELDAFAAARLGPLRSSTTDEAAA
jgi:hypothetical protein